MPGLVTSLVAEWRRATDVMPPHKEDSAVVRWFWEQVGSSSDAERGAVLFWLTGLRRPPVGGFRRLEKRMTLAVGGDVTRLPCWCVANGFFAHSFSAATRG